MGLNETIFERAQKTIPGGVNSPVRAFRQVGGAPRFIKKALGPHFWDIEDKLRKLEEEYRFDDEFISLARQVYITNDKRAELKRKINKETGSHYKEIKLY